MLELIVVIICLFLNAILSCVEMAFVIVSKSHLKKIASGGDVIAAKVLELKNNPERVLSVLQIGITLVGAISAAVGGVGAEESLSPIFQQKYNFSEEVSETLAIISVVLPITFFSVVIGELVPKTLALRFPMKFARFGGRFLHLLDKLFTPVVFLLEICTKLITRVFFSRLKSESISDVNPSIEIDNLTDTHKQYIFNLINIDKRKSKDVMLPWDQVSKVDHKAHTIAVMEIIKQSGHTRLPVVDQDMPVGILHSKEFIANPEISKVSWQQLLRPVIYMSSEEPILTALKTLQGNKSHLAIVRKNNLPIGIITIEDIIEEVVGEIYDEDDSPRALLSSSFHIRTMNIKKD